MYSPCLYAKVILLGKISLPTKPGFVAQNQRERHHISIQNFKTLDMSHLFFVSNNQM